MKNLIKFRIVLFMLLAGVLFSCKKNDTIPADSTAYDSTETTIDSVDTTIDSTAVMPDTTSARVDTTRSTPK